MTILSKITVGSRLYGTSISTSDTDYRGVYLPTRSDCLLGRVKDTIDDGAEEDTSYFSLQTFLRLASEGQSMAIEMLAAPDDMIVASSPVWDELRANRHTFYTKGMYSFLGYAKGMAAKYSARIDRLTETESILKVLTDMEPNPDSFGAVRLSALWDYLPESLNAVKSINERSSNADKRVYVVCGREVQATVTISHAYDVIKTIHESYGGRVRAAKEGKIDWKALGHAFRVTHQAKEIMTTGDLVFPLANADWLRELRLGHIDFLANRLDEKLDVLIAEVQALMDASSLPDKVDRDAVDQLILSAYSS